MESADETYLNDPTGQGGVSWLSAWRYFLRRYVLSCAAERGPGVSSRLPERSLGR